MLDWIKNRVQGAMTDVPELDYIIPVETSLGEVFIRLNSDGTINGNYEAFENHLQDTQIAAFAEDRIIFWLLLQEWRRQRSNLSFHHSEVVMDITNPALEYANTVIEVNAKPEMQSVESPAGQADQSTNEDYAGEPSQASNEDNSPKSSPRPTKDPSKPAKKPLKVEYKHV